MVDCSFAKCAVVADDPDLQQRVPELLEEQNEQACVDRSIDLKGAVLRAVLFRCHQPDEQEVRTSSIAETVNEIYRSEGEPLKVSSETVGHVLKSLGLYSRRLGSSGRGLRLDKFTQSRAHELGFPYDVLPEVPECGYCQDIKNGSSRALPRPVLDVEE